MGRVACLQAKITVPAGQNLTALFNTREAAQYNEVRRTKQAGQWVDTEVTSFEFERSYHPMSTYLVAIAVGIAKRNNPTFL